MIPRRAWTLSVALSVATACGDDSTTDGVGGASGASTSSGQTTTVAASGAQATTGATTTGAGSTGGDSGGGDATTGAGGDGAGDSSTGGTGGTDDSGTGGAGGDGAGGNGGDGTGGNGGEGGGSAAIYPSAVLADGPVIYYRLGEASGPTAANAATTGAAYDGTYESFGAGQLAQPGLIAADPDTSASFADPSYVVLALDGSTDAVEFDAGFTIDAWVSLTGTTGIRTILSTRGTGQDGYSFGVNTSGNLFLAAHGKTNYASTLAMPTDGSTHYVAVAFDGSGAATFYLDDQTETLASPAIAITYATSTELRLGMFGNGEGNSWTGVLDEIAAYPMALTTLQITAHRGAGL